MKPEAQRIAIAKALKIKCGRCNGTGRYKRIGDHEAFRISLSRRGAEVEQFSDCDHFTCDPKHPYAALFPDWLEDLNQIQAAVAKKAKRPGFIWRYRNTLLKVVYPLESLGLQSRIWLCVDATAAQRAEAFLRTLGLWVEEGGEG